MADDRPHPAAAPPTSPASGEVKLSTGDQTTAMDVWWLKSPASGEVNLSTRDQTTVTCVWCFNPRRAGR